MVNAGTVSSRNRTLLLLALCSLHTAIIKLPLGKLAIVQRHTCGRTTSIGRINCLGPALDGMSACLRSFDDGPSMTCGRLMGVHSVGSSGK